ncbi:MAG: exo-alpha-sialidase [Prevotellaceae bacterium]|nr:exo-alpha-sialidase [Prevotellaceae bacterium]
MLLTQMNVKADEAFRNHRYSSFKALPACKDGDIVFIGNSITNMMNWYEAFGSQQNIHGRGNSGGLSQEILDNLESMIAGNPSKVFLMIGTNDLGTLGDNYTPAAVAQRIQKILTRIHTEAPNATVYYQSILPTTVGNRTQAKTEETNALVKNWIEAYNSDQIVYVDLYTALVSNGALANTSSSLSATSYSDDGLHLTQKGYRIWMDIIKDYVGHDCVFPDNAANLWGNLSGPKGMRVTYFGASPVKDTDILLIGDEMIHNGEWHELLGSADFKDRGIGWGYPSVNINNVANTFDAILKGNTENGVSKVAPRAVCLYAGLSDVQAGSSAQTIFTAYKNAVNSLRQKLPDTPIFVMTILPFASNSTTQVQTIINVNTSIKETLVNEADKVYLIDAYSATYGTARDESCFMATGNIYLTGLGYARVAQEIAKAVNEALGTDYKAITIEEAEKNVERFNLRTSIYGNIYEGGTAIGYYTPEAVNKYYTDLQQLLEDFESGKELNYNELVEESTAAIKQALVLPSEENTEGREFQLFTPNRGSKYLTSSGKGKGVIGSEKNNYNEQRWQFVRRTDGKWDIKNVGDKSYLSPDAAYNTQISTSKTSPANGWDFSYSNNSGLYIISSGKVQLNQTNNEAVYNWSSGESGTDRSDLGCQFQIVDVTDIDADIREPQLYPTGSIDIQVNSTNGSLYRGGVVSTGWTSEWKSNDGLLTFSASANNMQWNGSNIDARSGSAQSSSYTITCHEDYVITGYTMTLTSLSISEQTWNFDNKTVVTSSTSDSKSVTYTDLFTQNISMSLTGANNGTLLTDFVVTLQSKKSVVKVDLVNGTISENIWTANEGNSVLTLKATSGTGTIGASDDELSFARGEESTTYTLATSKGYRIAGYEFAFSCTEGSITITPQDEDAVSGEDGYLSATGYDDTEVSFVLSGTANEMTTSNFYVYLEKISLEEIANDRFVVFETPTTGTPYRIPAIAKTINGDLVAVADYRYSKADIGMATNGKLDLRFRIKDHATGKWGEVQTLIAAKGSGSTNVAFGDPCIVADRESNRVMVTSCCGNVSFPNGTHANHQGWARMYSEDGGKTWSDYTDISQQVFEQLDKRSDGQIRCFFIGSGKIVQSTTVKVGDYYRLYCAALVKVNNGTNTNYVFYSDDFGENWHLLGTPDDCPIPSGADEPKAEELPDGSVLVSSRIGGGRYYNIYHFTNTATGEGAWGTMATSNSSVGGITASSNACNGETMSVPVVRVADGKKMFLLLQSVPFGPNDRSNVGINYKELADLADFRLGSDIAKAWDGKIQVTNLTSAYSTMTLDADNDVAFFYEENSKNSGYDMVYKKYSIEEITGGDYVYADMSTADSADYMVNAVDNYTESLENLFGEVVGMYSEEARTTIDDAGAAYLAAPSRNNYEALNIALATAKRVEIDPQSVYYLKNYGRSNANTTYVMSLNAAKTYFVGANAGTASVEAANQHFCFVPTGNEGEYYLYHPESQFYFGTLGANETQSTPVSTTANAGTFTISSSAEGLSALRNINHTGANWYIHLAGDCTRLVPWSATDPSLWQIVPLPGLTGIDSIDADRPAANGAIYDLTGRRLDSISRSGIYIIDGKKVIVK